MFLKSCLPTTTSPRCPILQNSGEIQNLLFQCHSIERYLYLFLGTEFTPSAEDNSLLQESYSVNEKQSANHHVHYSHTLPLKHSLSACVTSYNSNLTGNSD